MTAAALPTMNTGCRIGVVSTGSSVPCSRSPATQYAGGRHEDRNQEQVEQRKTDILVQDRARCIPGAIAEVYRVRSGGHTVTGYLEGPANELTLRCKRLEDTPSHRRDADLSQRRGAAPLAAMRRSPLIRQLRI
jgi:hypothetical protein